MKKLKEKLNNEKGKKLIIIFAMFATINIFAVDVAPRISDKEIVQNLADIKSEFKVVYSEIDGLRKEIKSEFKVVYSEIDGLRKEMHTSIDGLRKEMHTSIDGLRKEMKLEFKAVYAKMDSNKNELNAKFDAKFDGLNEKFDLMINVLWGFLASTISLIIGLLIHHFKVIAPVLVKYNDINETVKNIELPKKQMNNLINALKELAERDNELKTVLTKFNLL